MEEHNIPEIKKIIKIIVTSTTYWTDLSDCSFALETTCYLTSVGRLLQECCKICEVQMYTHCIKLKWVK